MELQVLNRNFQTIYFLDTFESLIWVDKMYEPGTFELYTPVTPEILQYIRPDNYLINPESEKVMIVEDFTIEADSENGDHIKIIGRSLESILERRIVWKQTMIDGKLQAGIKKLINENIISPTKATGGTDRQIDNFIFKESSDERITELKMCNEYTGDNLLDVIQKLCQSNKIGFKITLNKENQFVFELYAGVDRSYKQSLSPYVIFSPSFDNVENSNYLEAHSNFRNVALVAGEGEGSARKTSIVGLSTGIFRKELFVDARDLQSKTVGTAKKYTAALNQRGLDKLAENKTKREFDMKCDVSQYIYGEDFMIGDIVQVANEYGIEAPSRITEFTWSNTTSGVSAYPTFESINDEIAIYSSDDVPDEEFYEYLEQTKQLSTSQPTKFIFTNVTLDDGDLSLVDIACSIYGFIPTSVEPIEQSNGKYNLEVTFPKYSTAKNLTVRVYIN